MKNIFRMNFNRKNAAEKKSREMLERENSIWKEMASLEEAEIYETLDAYPDGLAPKQVEEFREKYGENVVTRAKEDTWLGRLRQAFVNPFTMILSALALVSLFTEVVWAEAGQKDPSAVLVITVMVLISGILRLVQETKSGNAAARLSEMLRTTACIERLDRGRQEILMEDIVTGDIVYLAAGDMIPADVRLLETKDLFISQSSLTGESEPVEKTAEKDVREVSVLEKSCLAFMGSNVVSGSAKGIVIAVGNGTLLGRMARQLDTGRTETSFEKGLNSVTWLLIRLMLLMIPAVLLLNGFVKGDWLNAALFAISIAIGLTPEMLPVIVTTCLARGAVAMSRRRVIMKDLNAIQNLGSMDLLCTDKTGTLTQDKIVLEYHLNIDGEEDDRVLRHAFLNSFYQTGLRNLIDHAIIERTRELAETKECFARLEESYTKIDEIPFDFERRRMSVVVADDTGKTQLITKGAVEEMLSVCSFAEYHGEIVPLSGEMKETVLKGADELNRRGMRVLGLAHKTGPVCEGAFSAKDEKDMVLIGYLAFLDLPKETTKEALAALGRSGVGVKVLTGDNEKVTQCICGMVGVETEHLLLGEEIELMDDRELAERAEKVSVFAKLSPEQKARVVTALRENGHSVGYMGDGINDSAALKAADVGISVDNAVDIAKECAQVILLEKDLLVLEQGILEGRKTYANMMKYIKLTASSNFGNMFSVLAASLFLPFLPMEAIQILLLNLVYDISCAAIPWDRVDEEFLEKPCRWNADSIARFMFRLGPVSSVFDILTYLLMYFVICPSVLGGSYTTLDAAGRQTFMALFQTGWFLESMWSQTLVIHLIRTRRLPFVQSRASLGVTFSGAMAIGALTLVPFLPWAKGLGLMPLPTVYFPWLFLLIAGYMASMTAAKYFYIRKYGELL